MKLAEHKHSAWLAIAAALGIENGGSVEHCPNCKEAMTCTVDFKPEEADQIPTLL